jgi:ferredoxin-nitrite reductase
MNDIERIKSLGLEVDLEKYISLGSTSFLGVRVRNAFPIHTAISRDDLIRLKWLGVIHNKINPAGFTLRLRVPNGVLNAGQLAVVAELAGKYGNGVVDITTRQGLEIRGVDFYYLPRILEDLEAVGLTSLQTAMDNIRNIVGCPLAGLTEAENIPALPLVREFERRVVRNEAFINLPRKINVAISGCACRAGTATNDIALMLAEKDGDWGFNLYLGGALSPPPQLSAPLDVFLKPGEAVEACIAVIEIFRDCGSRERRSRARLKFLLREWGMERFREELEARLGALESAGTEPPRVEHALLGLHPQPQEGLFYAGMLVPVGRMRASQAMELSRLAEEYGSGELRLTCQQNVIIPNVPEDRLDEMKGERLLRDFTLDASPLMQNLVACTGNDYCSFAQVESKSKALELVRYLEERLSLEEPLRIHFSGCANSCGKHQLADIGLRGMKVRIDGKLREAVSIFVGGSSGRARIAKPVAEKVPWSEAITLIEALLRGYLRERGKDESFVEWAARFKSTSASF